MASAGLLKEPANDYSDVKALYCDICIVRDNIINLMRQYKNHEIIVEKLEELISECSDWMECRRAA